MALSLLNYMDKVELTVTPSDITKRIQRAKMKASNIVFNAQNKVAINMTPEQGSPIKMGSDEFKKY